MEITVKIQAPELVEAILALADSLGQTTLAEVAKTSAPAATAAPAPRQRPSRAKIKEVPPVVTPTVSEVPADVVEEDYANCPGDDLIGEPVVEVTLEILRAKLSELSKNGKMDFVKELIVRTGAKSLATVDPEHYADMYAKVVNL